jgi:hypothetical protein
MFTFTSLSHYALIEIFLLALLIIVAKLSIFEQGLPLKLTIISILPFSKVKVFSRSSV